MFSYLHFMPNICNYNFGTLALCYRGVLAKIEPPENCVGVVLVVHPEQKSLRVS